LKEDILTSLKDVKGSEETIKYLEAVIKTIPAKDNPTSISDFNYEFSEEGNSVIKIQVSPSIG